MKPRTGGMLRWLPFDFTLQDVQKRVRTGDLSVSSGPRPSAKLTRQPRELCKVFIFLCYFFHGVWKPCNDSNVLKLHWWRARPEKFGDWTNRDLMFGQRRKGHEEWVRVGSKLQPLGLEQGEKVNRPFALRGHVTSFLWKWKLYDFFFKKRLVGHIFNKIIVIWFFKPAPFS